jgi:hypothetical protein
MTNDDLQVGMVVKVVGLDHESLSHYDRSFNYHVGVIKEIINNKHGPLARVLFLPGQRRLWGHIIPFYLQPLNVLDALATEMAK